MLTFCVLLSLETLSVVAVCLQLAQLRMPAISILSTSSNTCVGKANTVLVHLLNRVVCVTGDAKRGRQKKIRIWNKSIHSILFLFTDLFVFCCLSFCV